MRTALKFELFTPTGIFKTPFSVKGVETYPLPPYSTIIGLLYTAMGEKWKGETFSISVQGDYEVLFRDYIRFRKYNRKDRILETLPIEVPFLYNFRLTLHLLGEEELLERFKEALERPSRYLYLSGGELPAKVLSARFVELKKEELEDYRLEKNAYLPESAVKRFCYGRGVFFRIPSFYKDQSTKERSWEEVYYLQKGSYVSGKNVFVDREGDVLWL